MVLNAISNRLLHLLSAGAISACLLYSYVIAEEIPAGTGEASRPILTLKPILTIPEHREQFPHGFSLEMLDFAAVENRAPVPNIDKIQWQDDFYTALPATAVQSFKESVCEALRFSIDKLCDKLTFHESGRRSEERRSLGYIDVLNERIESHTDPVRVMIIAGTHGDEPSSVKLAFHWLNTIIDEKIADVYWRFIPALNPDGLLSVPQLRTNARGVDLNRNMPTLDWNSEAMNSWIIRSGSQQRFYPGQTAASEAETQFLVEQIRAFQPSIIVSIHAPYNLLDYDHSSLIYAPPNIGKLKLRRLGSFPGSLGRYSGYEREIPTVTIELADASKTPGKSDYRDMLTDLVYWINATHIGEPVATMPSTRKQLMIAENLAKQQRRRLQEKRALEIERARAEEELKSMPAVTQPYIIEESKKIDIVPVIL